jgi:NADPH-dependent curcumin reductase
MPQSSSVNRRFVLASRPNGKPTADNFRLEEVAIPGPNDREVLLRTLFLSLDPYMRGRISDAPSYATPVPLGHVIVGGTISRVEASRHPDFPVGILVLGYSGWQDYAVSNGTGLTKLPDNMPRPSQALGVLGMTGFTAYMGLLDIGKPKPGETIVVGAASGAVGSAVGQIGKLKGCRVVGVAGGPEKCRFAVQELGFDACIDHRAADLRQQLKEACPNGIDVYFENVGGAVLEAVLPQLNANARVPVCGLIAYYNDDRARQGEYDLSQLMRLLLVRRITMRGFIINLDYAGRYGEFLRDMSVWVRDGAVKDREDVVEGLENAPRAFIGLLEGKNFGKLVIRVAE